MKTISVIGGGISGLTAAYYLARQTGSQHCRITVIDAAPRMGGWVQTVPQRKPNDAGQGHFIFDKGPRSFRGATGAFPVLDDTGRRRLPSSRYTSDLIHRLGLMPEIIGIEKHMKSAHKRFILYDGQLEHIKLFACPATQGILRDAWQEFWRSPLPKHSDRAASESIHDFMERRFSPKVAEGIVNAIMHGVYAGDAKQLEIQSCIPWLPHYEQHYGSVGRGIFIDALSRFIPSLRTIPSETGNELAASLLHSESNNISRELSQFKLYSFKHGMERLTEALQDELASMPNVKLLYEHECTDIQFHQLQPHPDTRQNSRKVSVKIKSRADGDIHQEVDHVVCALPAYALSKILEANGTTDRVRQLSMLLSEIPYVDVGMVNIGFKNVHFKAMEGFGFLVPSREHNEDILGVVYDSTAFQHRQVEYIPAPSKARHMPIAHKHPSPVYHPDVTRFTVMLGGHTFEQRFGHLKGNTLEAHLADRSMSALARHLGVHDEPSAVDVSVHQRCIPQYTLGHAARLKRIQAILHGTTSVGTKNSSSNSNADTLPISLIGAAYRGVSVHDCIASGVRCAADIISAT